MAESWPSVRLKHLASLPRATPTAVDEYVGLEHVDSSTGILLGTSSVDEMSSDGLAAKRGDVLFGKLRPYLAKVWCVDRCIACSSEFAVLRPGSGIDARFLQFLLLDKRLIDDMTSLTYGTRMPRVSPDQLGNYVIGLPSLPTQRGIATFLDRKSAMIDALIEKKRRLLGLLEQKRTALITRAVTRGLDPDVPMKDSGVEWLGQVPASWEVRNLRSLARPGADTFTDGDWIESPFIRDEGIRLIQTGNIGVGAYREQGFRYIDADTFDDFACTEVMPGDVLICRLAAPVGRACLAPDLGVRMITSVDVCILKPSADVLPEFVVYALSSRRYLGWMEAVSRGSTRDRVSRSGLGATRIPLPDQSEQRRIVDDLAERLAALEQLETAHWLAISLLQEYRTALISAAVTGRIEVPEATA